VTPAATIRIDRRFVVLRRHRHRRNNVPRHPSFSARYLTTLSDLRLIRRCPTSQGLPPPKDNKPNFPHFCSVLFPSFPSPTSSLRSPRCLGIPRSVVGAARQQFWSILNINVCTERGCVSAGNPLETFPFRRLPPREASTTDALGPPTQSHQAFVVISAMTETDRMDNRAHASPADRPNDCIFTSDIRAFGAITVRIKVVLGLQK